MKVKKTLKGNARITLTMAELEDLKTLLTYSHYIGCKDKTVAAIVESSEHISLPICLAINEAVREPAL